VETLFKSTINGRRIKEVNILALETPPTSPPFCRTKVSAKDKQYEENMSQDKEALTFHLNKSNAGHKYDITQYDGGDMVH